MSDAQTREAVRKKAERARARIEFNAFLGGIEMEDDSSYLKLHIQDNSPASYGEGSERSTRGVSSVDTLSSRRTF